MLCFSHSTIITWLPITFRIMSKLFVAQEALSDLTSCDRFGSMYMVTIQLLGAWLPLSYLGVRSLEWLFNCSLVVAFWPPQALLLYSIILFYFIISLLIISSRFLMAVTVLFVTAFLEPNTLFHIGGICWLGYGWVVKWWL